MSSTPDSGAPSQARGPRVPRQTRLENPDARMPLMEHIRELRNRLLKALLGLALGMVVGWIFFKPAWKFIERPFCKIPQQNRLLGTHGCTLVSDGLFDGFLLQVKRMFGVGLIVCSPIWLYQL